MPTKGEFLKVLLERFPTEGPKALSFQQATERRRPWAEFHKSLHGQPYDEQLAEEGRNSMPEGLARKLEQTHNPPTHDLEPVPVTARRAI